jgi:hypothetical protein
LVQQKQKGKAGLQEFKISATGPLEGLLEDEPVVAEEENINTVFEMPNLPDAGDP